MDCVEKYPLCAAYERAMHKNPCSILVELVQKQKRDPSFKMPEFICETTLSEKNQNLFSMSITFEGEVYKSDFHSSKRQAKNDCARAVIEKCFSKDVDFIIRTQQIIYGNETTFGELLKQHSFELLFELSKEAPFGNGTERILSSFFIVNALTSEVRCVSLATGNKCIRGNNMSLHGHTITDCHAEILARRGLLKFLYAQIAEYYRSPETSIFEPRGFSAKLVLKPEYSFHLFVNSAPCGDSRLYAASESQSGQLESESDRNKGKLRFKIEDGMGTVLGSDDPVLQTIDSFERLKVQSCSDKILRWNVLGVQGSLLLNFIEPIYINSVSVDQLFGPRIQRAIAGRLEGFAPPVPFRINSPVCTPCQSTIFTTVKPSKVEEKTSVNWNIVDKCLEPIHTMTGRKPNGEESRLSRANFAFLFVNLLNTLMDSKISPDWTYAQLKASNVEYVEGLRLLTEFFASNRMGYWRFKSAEFSMFTLKEAAAKCCF